MPYLDAHLEAVIVEGWNSLSGWWSEPLIPPRVAEWSPRLLSEGKAAAVLRLIEQSSFSDILDIALTAITHVVRLIDTELGEMVELVALALRVAKIVVFSE